MDNEAAVACPRSVDIDRIRDISNKLYDDSEHATAWPFQPTQGKPLLEKFGSQSGYDGAFFRVPIITSTVTDEAKCYLPGDIETSQKFLDYPHNVSPELNSEDIALLDSLHPDPATNPTSPFAGSPNSAQHNLPHSSMERLRILPSITRDRTPHTNGKCANMEITLRHEQQISGHSTYC